jgi:hypothetical protein
MAGKRRTKQQLSGQAGINFLERCLTLTAMSEQRRQGAQSAWFEHLGGEPWSSGGCPNDFAHAHSFGLTGADGESFLDWCANQRHYFLLCESGMDDYEASREAQNDRNLRRGQASQ